VRQILWIVVAASCGGTELEAPVLPVDYAATFSEVRNCRPSLEHGPDNIRVLAAPDAVPIYKTRTGTFATGALIVKEQYYPSDPGCSGKIKQWTVMQKLPGDAPDTLGWHWQRIDASRHTTQVDDQTCIACHANCGGAGGGFLDTCTDP
jgi:hypothetical protein